MVVWAVTGDGRLLHVDVPSREATQVLAPAPVLANSAGGVYVPGSRYDIEGEGLAAATVRLNGVEIQPLSATPAKLTFLVPASTSLGDATLKVAVADSPFQPATRAVSIRALSPRFVGPPAPAAPGETITLQMRGLGSMPTLDWRLRQGYSGAANSVAVDPFGKFFVAGDFTNPHFPIGDNAPSPAKPNFANLIKFSASGRLLYAAQLPVTPSKVLTDSEGNLYIAGNANVTQTVPVTAGAYQTVIDPNCPNNSKGLFAYPRIEKPRHMTDVYLAKLDPEAKSVFFATLFGGACRDTVTDFTVGPDGSLHVVGDTYSDPLLLTSLSFPAPPPEILKPFVARLDATGSHLLLSTYLDIGDNARIAAGAAGDSFVAESASLNWSTNAPPSTLLPIVPAPAAALLLRRVTDAFSLKAESISPGEIVQLDVSGLAPEPDVDLGLTPPSGAPFEMSGISVQFDGVRAPLLAVHRDEIYCVTPSALRGKTDTAMQVRSGAGCSTTCFMPA
jgi:hypothetical protein